MFKKSLLKVALVSVMLVTANIGFSQNSDSKWEIEYLTDAFGDKNGKCVLVQTCLSEGWAECEIRVMQLGGNRFAIGVRARFKDEITDRDAYLSLKTENNKVIEAEKGLYVSGLKIAVFEVTSEIISLFKNSSKLKMALRLSGISTMVIEVDCMGFTKAFNEIINCK